MCISGVSLIVISTITMSQNVRRYNKFTFSDFRFAAFVRARMLEVLVQFDVNGNQ